MTGGSIFALENKKRSSFNINLYNYQITVIK